MKIATTDREAVPVVFDSGEECEVNCTGVTQGKVSGGETITDWMNSITINKLDDSYHEGEITCNVTFSSEDGSYVVSDPDKPAEVFVLKVI